MFLPNKKPKDFDCGLNLDLMIEALPRIEDEKNRIAYANRIVGLIKKSHINWVNKKGESKMAWDYFYQLASYNPEVYGVVSPYKTGEADTAR